jgi:hypothetical protein
MSASNYPTCVDDEGPKRRAQLCLKNPSITKKSISVKVFYQSPPLKLRIRIGVGANRDSFVFYD